MVNLISRITGYKDPATMQINQGYYYIEMEKEIIYITSPGSVISFLPDGKVLRLSQKCNNFEWELHKELYSMTKGNNDCRLEIPVTRSVVDIEGVNYYYLEVQRPNSELGINFIDELLTVDVDNNYFEKYIYDTSIMLGYLKIVCKKHNYNYVPSDLLAPYKRNKDTKGYFWIDFKTWNYPLNKFIEKKLRTLYLTLISLKENLDYETLMNSAENNWKFFYE